MKIYLGTTWTCMFLGGCSRSKISLPPTSNTRSRQKLNHWSPKYFSWFALSTVIKWHPYLVWVWSSMNVVVFRFPFRTVLDISLGKCMTYSLSSLVIHSTTFFSKCRSSTASIFGFVLAELGLVFLSVSLLHFSFRTLFKICLGIYWIEINICEIAMIDKRIRKGKGYRNKFIKELKIYLNLFLLEFRQKKNWTSLSLSQTF